MTGETDRTLYADRIRLPEMPRRLRQLGTSVNRATRTISDTEGGWFITVTAAVVIAFVIAGLITATVWSNEQTAELGLSRAAVAGALL